MVEAIQLPADFQACERGNVWLYDDMDHNAWFKLEPGCWLQLSIRMMNYPSLNVSTCRMTEAELAAHINANLVGFKVMKCNIDGVKVDAEGIVCEEGTEL